jgi:hypothetical protein
MLTEEEVAIMSVGSCCAGKHELRLELDRAGRPRGNTVGRDSLLACWRRTGMRVRPEFFEDGLEEVRGEVLIFRSGRL